MEGKGKDHLGISMAFLAFFLGYSYYCEREGFGRLFLFRVGHWTLGFVDRSRIEGVEV